MQRSYSTPAIVLTLKPSGENNTTVTLLTPQKGIQYVTLYGGPKSKMRSLVAQWNSGTAWLYETPEKNQTKISDFEVKNYHSGFGQNLFKMYAASLACELAIKTRCAGSNQQCFNLIKGFFDGMELCNEEQSRLGLVRFLWRFIELLGIQPDASVCGHCSSLNPFAPDKISYYNNRENCFICSDCSAAEMESVQDKQNLFFPVKNPALVYLGAIQVLSPSEVRKLQIDKEGYEQLKEIAFFLIENCIEQKLNSIETGMGIL